MLIKYVLFSCKMCKVLKQCVRDSGKKVSGRERKKTEDDVVGENENQHAGGGCT